MRRIAQLRVGETATIKGKVLVADNLRTPRSQMLLTKVAIQDDTGIAYLVWFNQWYLKNKFVKLLGKEIVVYGTAQLGSHGIEIVNPEWEEVGVDTDPLSSNRIVPIYPLTEGLYQGTVRRIIYQALERFLPSVRDILPKEVRARRNLVNLAEALANIHFPESETALEKARFRLVYEEFFLLQLALALRRQNLTAGEPGIAFQVTPECTKAFYDALPFELTDAQKRVIAEIERDMASPKAMNRLLQGDVGSGKTIVAIAAIMIAVHNGYQAALMAPTEILAEQHYLVLRRMLEGLGLNVVLLTGSLPAKREACGKGKSRFRRGKHHNRNACANTRRCRVCEAWARNSR